jgi:hypothetical protein
MMGVAPPAPAPGSSTSRTAAAGPVVSVGAAVSVGAPARGATAAPVGVADSAKAAASEGARRPPPPRRGGTMLGLNPPGVGVGTPAPRAVVGFDTEPTVTAPLAPLNLDGVVDLGEHELDSLPPSPLEVESPAVPATPVTDIPVATVTRSEAPPPNLPPQIETWEPTAPYHPPPIQQPGEVGAAAFAPSPAAVERPRHQPLPADLTAPPKAIPRPAPPPKSRSGVGAVLWLGAFLLSVVGVGCIFYFLLPNSDVARTLRGWVSELSADSTGHTVAKSGVVVPSPSSELAAPSASVIEAAPAESGTLGSAGAPALALSASGAVTGTEASAAAIDTAGVAAIDTASAASAGTAPGTGGAGAEVVPAGSATNSTIPPGVDQTRLQYLMQLAIKKAEQCHLGGRAVGTAQVFASFGTDGRVADVRLEGEPIASAPVATCVINKIKAVLIKPYEGAPFVYETTLTLR